MGEQVVVGFQASKVEETSQLIYMELDQLLHWEPLTQLLHWEPLTHPYSSGDQTIDAAEELPADLALLQQQQKQQRDFLPESAS